MHPFRFVLISIFVCIWSVHAESLPSFDMDTCVGEATTIVQGKLDSKGELEVSEIFSGPSAPSQRLKIDVGSYEAENLRKLVDGDGPFEVVAFLMKKNGEEWGLVLQYAGIVGFKGQAVFLMADDLMGSRFTKHEPFTKGSFLQALKKSIASDTERKHLIAEPRSIDRTKRLIAFALEHCQANEEKDGFRVFHPDYQLGQIAAALNNPTEDDQNALFPSPPAGNHAARSNHLIRLGSTDSVERWCFGSNRYFFAKEQATTGTRGSNGRPECHQWIQSGGLSCAILGA